ncbi:MAG TPA: hypothetical protein VMF51_18115 [Nocardioides sp.]|nr:hypothetical protein [Nocardioides sp.]HTW17051.1 hypothetical protein [Nocardioides sp.]
MTCEARLAGDGLACTRIDPHEPHRGCVYESTSGVPGSPKEEL